MVPYSTNYLDGWSVFGAHQELAVPCCWILTSKWLLSLRLDGCSSHCSKCAQSRTFFLALRTLPAEIHLFIVAAAVQVPGRSSRVFSSWIQRPVNGLGIPRNGHTKWPLNPWFEVAKLILVVWTCSMFQPIKWASGVSEQWKYTDHTKTTQNWDEHDVANNEKLVGGALVSMMILSINQERREYQSATVMRRARNMYIYTYIHKIKTLSPHYLRLISHYTIIFLGLTTML